MATDLRAHDLGHGILLSGVASPTEALYLQQYFGDNGLTADVSSASEEHCQIFLQGVSLETYEWLRTGVSAPFSLPEVERRIADTKARIEQTRAAVKASRELNRQVREGLDRFRQQRDGD